jgi:hypothetical protein
MTHYQAQRVQYSVRSTSVERSLYVCLSRPHRDEAMVEISPAFN